jgi:hypothetical protein
MLLELFPLIASAMTVLCFLAISADASTHTRTASIGKP